MHNLVSCSILVVVVFFTCCNCLTRRRSVTSKVYHSAQSLVSNDLILDIVNNKEMFKESFDLASVDFSSIVKKAGSKAFDGGVAGASAAAVQVLSLMWLRTAINYQYRYGTTTMEALTTLYTSGGIPRLYQGLPFAMLQGPLSRFGDTAANALVASLFESLDPTGQLYPVVLRTGLGSVSAAVWRILLMPIDTVKTTLQVDGGEGLKLLRNRVDDQGLALLFNGALAASAATFVGHFPWFLTYNYLSDSLPHAEEIVLRQLFGMQLDVKLVEIARSAFIGLCASCASDVSSNSLRVLKTVRQTGGSDSSYLDIAKAVTKKEGLSGLFGRGLQTRLFANALQGMLFSVLFKYFQAKG